MGTAVAADVLSGKTFTNSTSSGLNGSMTNQGTKTYTINPGGSQTIPAGYHSGSGYVAANANQNSGTYTFASGSTGSTVDMGINNTYRYVNASNVYNKGKSDASNMNDVYFWEFTSSGGNPAGYWTKGIKNATWNSFDYGGDTLICDGYVNCNYGNGMTMYVRKGACYAGIMSSSGMAVRYTNKSVYDTILGATSTAAAPTYAINSVLFNSSWYNLQYTALLGYGVFMLKPV